jgi:hypothetical protein
MRDASSWWLRQVKVKRFCAIRIRVQRSFGRGIGHAHIRCGIEKCVLNQWRFNLLSILRGAPVGFIVWS